MDTPAKKVLIVDDDRTLCEALHEKLIQAGYTVDVAHTGEEGLSRIQQFSPELVLLDIGMPVMSGTELLERYKEHASSDKIQFIVMTNNETMTAMADVFTYEITDFVSKSETSPEGIVELVSKRLS